MRKSDRMRLWRKSGWTYRGLAAELGLHMSVVMRAVKGDSYPRKEVQDGIARALGVPAEELFPPKSRPTLAAA